MQMHKITKSRKKMKMQKMHKITKKIFFLNGFEKLYLLGIPQYI